MTTKKTTKKPRRLTAKQVAKVLREYNLPGRVEAYLATLGDLVWRHPPELPPVPWEQKINHGGAWMRERVILTKAGPLGISVYDDWIACVFDDADEGARLAGATRPSGKWNHHAFVGYCHKPTDPQAMIWTLHDTLDRFIVGVEDITLDRHFADVHAEIEDAGGWLRDTEARP